MAPSNKYTLLPSVPELPELPAPIEQVPESETNVDETESNARRRVLARRAFTFIVALSLLVAAAVLFFFLYKPSSPRRRHHEPTDHLEDIANDPRLERYQTPDDAQICKDWPEGQGSLTTVTFDIPASTGLLFFLSRGQVSGGNFHFIHSEGSAPPTIIAVRVTAQFEDRKELERTKACRAVSPDYNEHGILLWADSDHVQFNITVTLPNIQQFGDISTNLPNFSHHIASFFDIWRPVVFGVVRFKSANAPIFMDAIIGASGFIQTSNARLEGAFFGAGQIQMQTSNANLRAIVWAWGQADGALTDVVFRTANGPIDVGLAAVSDFADTKLKVTAETTNGGVNVSMPTRGMQDDVGVYLDVSTSNAPVNIFLHPEYEGTYDLQTSLEDAVLQWDPNLRDPSGKGRSKTLVEAGGGGRTRKQGRMFWGEEASVDGSIKVRSSTEPVTLYCNPELSAPRVDDIFGQNAFRLM